MAICMENARWSYADPPHIRVTSIGFCRPTAIARYEHHGREEHRHNERFGQEPVEGAGQSGGERLHRHSASWEFMGALRGVLTR